MPESEQKPPDEQDYNTPSVPYAPYQPETNERQSVHLESTEVSSAQEMPAETEEAHQPATEQASAQTIEQRKRRRVGLLLGSAVCIVALPLIIFGIWNYLNRSTPMKTLDVFCQALQREDYHTAFIQFTPKLQSQMVAAQMDEKTFAALLKQDKITSCTHGYAGEGGPDTMTTLKLVHLSKNVNNDIVTLIKDSTNNWKIDLLQVAPQQ